MSDCPYCDEWRYNPFADCIAVRQVSGSPLPVIWDGRRLRIPSASDEPDGRHTAAGRHICQEHPTEPDVLSFGPLVEFAPLEAISDLRAYAGF